MKLAVNQNHCFLSSLSDMGDKFAQPDFPLPTDTLMYATISFLSINCSAPLDDLEIHGVAQVVNNLHSNDD